MSYSSKYSRPAQFEKPRVTVLKNGLATEQNSEIPIYMAEIRKENALDAGEVFQRHQIKKVEKTFSDADLPATPWRTQLPTPPKFGVDPSRACRGDGWHLR